MKKIKDIMDNKALGKGIPPVFTPAETTRLENLSRTSKYWRDAHDLVHSYKRGSLEWDDMGEKQRMWLWKVKDDVANIVRKAADQG